MPRIAKPVVIDGETFLALQKISRSRTTSKMHILRAEILIALSNHVPFPTIAANLGICESTVTKLKAKFFEFQNHNLTHSQKRDLYWLLNDRKRSGRGIKILLEDQNRVCKLLCEKPSDHELVGDRWTLKRASNYLRQCNQPFKNSLENVSPSYICKLCKKRNIVPHKIRSYLTSNDPQFKEKAHKIASIYQEIRDGNTRNKVTISVDEKTSIQALKNIHKEIMPLEKGNNCRLRDPEYKRLGTRALIAGTDLQTKELHGLVTSRNDSESFIEFLKMLDENTDPHLIIRLIMDNFGTHLSQKTQAYFSSKGDRFELIFLPTHSSWMNPIEGVFSKLSRAYLKDLRVDSIEELEDVIIGAINELNADLARNMPAKKVSNGKRMQTPKIVAAKWERFIQSYFNR
jgi:transposase